MAEDPYAVTHGPSLLAEPETIAVGDLIFREYGWRLVLRVQEMGRDVIVTYARQSRAGGGSEWTPCDKGKRTRVRRRIGA